jgi:hypothetical protein
MLMAEPAVAALSSGNTSLCCSAAAMAAVCMTIACVAVARLALLPSTTPA